MNYPDVQNESGLAFDALHVCNESGIPVFAPLVQATCRILADGRVGLLKEQPPVNLAGEWYGDPATTSLKLEPQMAFMKPATDVALLGHAYPTSNTRTEGQVGIKVGPIQKVARVFGNRWLISRPGSAAITPPEPFERIPLIYERSFGGWDRRYESSEGRRCEPRNPVGVGFRDPTLPLERETMLPNFEDPGALYRAYGDTPPPVGFGFVQPAWQPRAAYAGTFDDAWDKSRKPLLPVDFDRRFFNSASSGLIAPGFLKGDEPVIVLGAGPEGRVDFNLPGIVPPPCRVGLRVGKSATPQMPLDTVIVDMDSRTLTMIWRGHLLLRNGPHDIVAVEIAPEPEAEASLDSDEL